MNSPTFAALMLDGQVVVGSHDPMFPAARS